jgi:hypothetical protein
LGKRVQDATTFVDAEASGKILDWSRLIEKDARH